MAPTQDMNQPTPLPTDPGAISAMATPPAPQAPAQPTGQPPVPPVSQVPAQSTGQPSPAQPSQPAPAPQSPHARMFDSIIKRMTNPSTIVNPDGTLQTARPSLSNSILAGALAGLLTPNTYRDTPYGQVLDSSANAANSFKAGSNMQTKAQTDWQAQVDKQQANKLATVKNNVDMMKLYAATMNDMGKSAQQQVDNSAPMLNLAHDHDQHLQNGDTNKAVLASGMLMADVLKHPEFGDALTKHTIVPDGVVYVDDGQGHMIPTQTWSVIDPSVRVSLDQASVDVANQINPQFGIAFEKSGGNMQLRLGQIQTVTQQVSSVHYAERLFQDAADSDDKGIQSLGLKGDINGEIMNAVKNGAPGANQALSALMEMEHAKLSGGTGIADSLNRLVNDPENRAGASYILSALGTTPEKVKAYLQSEANKQAAAKKDADTTNQLFMKQQESDIELSREKKLAAYKKSIGVSADDTDSISPTKTYPNEWIDPKTGMHYNLSDSIYNMVEHNEDPSQLTKRSKNYDANFKKANDYSFARYGKTFDAAQTAEDYKYANQKTTQDTVKMLQSLTGDDGKNKGGTLSQLSNDLTALGNTPVPKFNELTTWASKNTGRPEVTNVKATLFAVADEMAKILGGGNATVEGYRQAHEVIDAAFSNAQGEGAVTRLRAAMANRQNSMVAKNVYLDKQYGRMDNPLTQGGQGGQGAPKVVPPQKVPVIVNGRTVGYADDKKGTNYTAF